ncbi:choice-of-anchor D domain-containing protein, partial [Runella sp. CRIBMP]|uniref:choice-of-anchor D domain-containing protein n=1 Tax=Runella sp. CRIBMP TaxID=2683261 RepID=UPI0014129C45
MKKLFYLFMALMLSHSLFAQPEINIKGRNVTILSGDTSPSTDDNTSFNRQYTSGATVTQTFTIENIGTTTLTLTGNPAVTGTNSGDFTVTTSPSLSIPAGGSTTFSIRFDPSATGTRTATVTVNNNDSSEGAYTFSISGIGQSVTQVRWVNNQGASRPSTVTLDGVTYPVFANTYTDIQSAINAAVTDDIVYITNGLYRNPNEATSNSCVFSGTGQQFNLYLTIENKGITLTSETGNHCTSDARLVGYGIFTDNASNTLIQGLHLDSVRVNGFWDTNFATGSPYSQSGNLKIRNNKISNTRGHGIKTDTGGPTGVPINRGAWDITGNYFENIGFYNAMGDCPTPSPVTAIWLGEAGNSFLISNNIIDNTKWAGILCDGYGGYQSMSSFPNLDGAVTISGNRINRTVDAGIQIGFSSGTPGYYPTNAYITHNTITNANTGQSLGSGAITVLSSNVKGKNITYNDVSTSFNGLAIDIAGWESASAANPTYVNYNNFYNLTSGSFGVTHKAGISPNGPYGTADNLTFYNFENNYWGAANGPMYTTNPSGTGVALRKETVAISGVVYSTGDFDFTPYSTTANTVSSASLSCCQIPTAGISYSGSPFSTNGSTVSVNRTGTPTGTFTSSPAGLNLNGDTGLITPSLSTPGTYTVTYLVAASGSCNAVTATVSVTIVIPEMNLKGNGVNIVDGDTSPTTTDHTDFGTQSVASGTVVRTFTIENTGTGALTLSGSPLVSMSGINAGDFIVTQLPTTPVAATNGFTTFQITFDPSAGGLRTATVSIANDDTDENPYTFSIQGTGSTTCSQVATTTQSMSWNGSVSNDWTNPCNWTPNGVPTQTNPVVISNAVPVVIPSGTNAAAKSISLNGGFGNKASLTISQGSELRMGSTESTATKFNMVQYATVTNNGLLIFEQSGGGGVNSTFEMGFDDNIFHNYGAVVINSTNSTPIQIGNNGVNGPSATFNNYACATFVNYAGQMLLNSIGASIFNNAGLFRTSGNLAIVGPFTNQSGGVVFVGGTLPNNPITSSGGSVRVNNNPANTNVFTYTGTYTGTVNGIFTNEAATTSAGTYTQATNTFNPSGALPAGSQTLYAKITPSGGACNYVVPFTYQNGCSQVATSTETMTWTGSVSTDWANPCNWSPNGVPSATNAVTIPAATNDPIILSGSMVAKHLQITGSGASLTVNNGASLTVSSTEGALTLSNNGLLTNRGTINATNSNPNFVSTYALGLGSNTTFDNYGTVNLTSSQNTGLEVGNGSTVHNYTGGLISIAARGGIRGEGPFINDSGATISISGTNSAIQYNGSVSNSGLIEATGQIEANSGAQINNNACGTIKLTADYFNGLLATTINNGFILIGGTLHSPSGGTFTNNAVLKYGALNVSSILTNSGNASIVVNNTPTPIFTYGGTYNGTGSSTVNGIFTNSTATASAGTFTAPITFVPDVSLPAGLQTLYAKITPSGGACFYVVPFTYNNTFPEMNVKGNGVSINDNDSSPRTADNTDFGAQLVASGTVVRTFTIENTGSGTLNLSGSPLVSIGGTNAGDFTVTQLPTTPVAATNGTTTFQITFDPSASGLRTATVSIANNDSDENPYNFSIQGTGAAPADYTITTTGNNVVITDVTGTGETLDISESGSNIRFNVTGKTYSIDGGTTTAFTTPADIALAGKTGITINGGNGNDIINVAAFSANLPGLTINGGTGDDQVNFNGDITFAANANLDVDMQNDDATPGTDQVSFTNNANLVLSGTGAAVIKVSRNINFSNGTASLETTNGNLTLEANQQATATTGNFIGIAVSGATVRVNGTGTLTVKGKSGNDSVINQFGILVQNGGLISGGTNATATIEGSAGAGSANGNIGVYVTGTNARITSLGGNVSVVGLGGSTGASSTSRGVAVTTNGTITAGGSGTVTVSGTGGAGTGNFNAGVYVAGSANTFITSSGGNVSVTGVGGGTGSGNNNYGIWMELGGTITAGGTSTVTVSGQGGGTTGGSNFGVKTASSGAQITSSGGNITVTGIEGSGSGSIGISHTLPAALTTATNGGNITLISNSMDLGGTVSTQLLGNTTLRPYTNNVPINLGTSSNTISGPLGLSDTELDQVTTGTLIFGNSNSGDLTVLADITRPASTNVQLVSGGDVLISGGGFNTGGGTLLLDPGTSPKAVKPTFNGTDVTASTLSFASDLQIAINGATAGDGTGGTHSQLKVIGSVNLTGVNLLFEGTYVPVAGNTFTIVDNDGSDVITGTFTGLAEGATLSNFRGSGRNATISYTGGSGNDVVIAINNTNPTIIAAAVTRQEGSPGSSATIATVNDAETPAGSLTVTVTTLPQGITITNITNVSGTVTATVAANCFAGIGSKTVVLTVTDANGGTATANFTVNVTANTAPTLTYNNAFFSPGVGGTILPATGPVDNGEVNIGLQSVSPSPSPATITVNNLTGAVSVPNTIPVGIYTITVVASDVCTTATVVPITLNVQSADYTITTTGGNVVITDVTGTGETLAVSESSGNIRFNVAGKTYSIDGGPTTVFTTPAEVALAGKTSITVNTAVGNDIINVGAFSSNLPSLTINGGTGDDQVFMNGDITFAVNANLDLDLQNDDATPGTDAVTFASGTNLVLSGTGTATVKVSKNTTFNTGSTLITVNGNLTVEANQQAIPTAGNFIGVLITGTNTQLQTSINGTLTVKGKGGDDASGSQQGVKLAAGGKILGGEGANAVMVVGTGGASSGSSNYGVWLTDANSRIFSLGGPVNVTGTGGGSGTSGGNVGVRVTSSGEITSAGGNVTVVGQGGLNATGNSNSGISVQASGKITSNDTGGNVTITGTGGGSGASALNAGIFLADGELSAGGSGTVDITGQGGAGTGISNNGLALEGLVTSKGGNITLTGKLGGGSLGTYGIYMSKQMSAPVSSILTNVHGGNISIITNSFYIVDAPDIRTTAAGSVTIKPFTAGKEISIFGGFDGVSDPLMLSDLELDRITTGTLVIGDATSGDITSSIGITRPSVTNIQFVSGGDIVISGGNINTNGGTLLLDPGTSPKAVKPTFNGTDVTVSTLSFAGDLSIAINGATAGDGTSSTYSQLKIVGAVNLTGVNLVFSGSYTPTGSETFTIVDNDGSDAITGTFNGLAQGATISNFLGSGLNATISYTGGDGNDVVISVAVVNPDYTITTTSNNLIITDISGNGETLDISQNSTNIRFNVTGRKFSLNGGIATNFPADVALAGKTSITVNTAVGNDIINVGAFSSNLPSLTINGGTGDDAVNFNGNLTLAANANLDLDLQNDDANPGTDAVLIASNAVVTLSGTGTATVKASKNLTVNTGASLITQNGNLIVEANQQTTPTTGDFVGVDVNGGTLKVTGSGLTLVKGKGGTTNSDRYGIVVQNGGLIEAGNNSLTVQGTGGGGIVSNNYGVLVTDPNSKITSSGGNVSVTGQGGGNGNAFNNYGVYLASSGLISAGGTGTVTVQGTGGNGSGGYNFGIYLAASSVTSTNGNISLTGQAGGESESGSNEGILLDFASRISAGGTGSIYMEGTGSGSADGFNYGINIEGSNSQIITNNGNIQLVGVGGNGTGTATGDSGINVEGPITAGGTGTIHLQGTGASKPFSHGVIIESPVTTNDGNITLIGVGGADATAQFGSYGVEIVGTVTAGNGKSIIVQGTAGSSTGLFNAGVFIGVADALSSTTGGTIQVTGIEGGSGTGILMESEGSISTLTNGGNITLITNSLDMSGTSAISTNTASSVTLRPYTNGVGVDLGASSNTLGGPLSLTDAELDRITAGTINVGNTNSGVITVSAAISRAVNTTFNLTSGGTVNLNASSLNINGGILNINAVGGISPTAAGIDASAGTVAFTAGNDLNIVINGTTADTDYRQLNVAGSVNLTGLDLVLSTINAFIPLGGATFTIVNNDGSDAIIGTFNGLAEGATLANFLGSGLNATISYTGGTGNDVVITVVCPAFAAPTASVTAQPDCTTPTGTIVVTAPTGGNIQYSVGGTYQSSGTFSGLAPNTYSVTAKNTASGCISEALSLVVNVVPGAPTLTGVTLTQPTCGVPTGTAVVNATGSGTLEYSKDGMNWQLSNTFSLLSPANYTFSVRLQSNPTCVATSTSQTINVVPGAPTLTDVTLTQPTCGVPTGTAVVNATGSGTLEYSKDGMNWQTSNTFSLLSPANYTFSVRLQS